MLELIPLLEANIFLQGLINHWDRIAQFPGQRRVDQLAIAPVLEPILDVTGSNLQPHDEPQKCKSTSLSGIAEEFPKDGVRPFTDW
jgi:hypothetical protein